MTRDDAIKLLHLYAKIGADLDQSVAFRMDHDSEFEANGGALPTGKVMGEVYFELMKPIYKEFPDLLPDYLDGPYSIPETVYEPRFYYSAKERPALKDRKAWVQE